jgi:hypothetical protein
MATSRGAATSGSGRVCRWPVVAAILHASAFTKPCSFAQRRAARASVEHSFPFKGTVGPIVVPGLDGELVRSRLFCLDLLVHFVKEALVVERRNLPGVIEPLHLFREPPSIWEKTWPSTRDHWTMEIPGALDGFKVTFKDPFVMNLDSLGFFLANNVFALENRGQGAVKINTETGLLTPHDVMLVGHIV